MNYREICDRPQEIRRRIEHQIEDVNYKWNLCQNITASLGERVQTSPSNNTERCYLSYIESKRKLDKLYDELEVAEATLRELLYNNLDSDLADMLEWRYIEGKTVKEIADIIGMKYESAKNKISRANRQLEKAVLAA